MRVKLYTVDNAGGVMRITPAHAGKTNSIAYLYKSIRDHPRACG